jgi:hypothetical protein
MIIRTVDQSSPFGDTSPLLLYYYITLDDDESQGSPHS